MVAEVEDHIHHTDIVVVGVVGGHSLRTDVDADVEVPRQLLEVEAEHGQGEAEVGMVCTQVDPPARAAV